MGRLRSLAGKALINSRFPWTGKKILVIESDDWGAEVVRTEKHFQELIKLYPDAESDPYCRYDAVAKEEDLQKLFEFLKNFRDHTGRPACITANTNMGNPDFDKIKAGDFQTYHWIDLEKTLDGYSQQPGSLLKLWKEGMKQQVFRPQLHGREHVNVNPWLKRLREDVVLDEAFELGVTAMPVKHSVGNRKDYRAAFDFDHEGELEFHRKVIEDSSTEFKRIFGFASRTFIATCYTWGSPHEKWLKKNGIDVVQGNFAQKAPAGFGSPYRYIKHRQGTKGNHQRYLVRNVICEPSLIQEEETQRVSRTLSEIQMAFLFGKPAILSMHRLNFIGSRDAQNSDRTYSTLSKVLQESLIRWPNLEFRFSDEIYAT